MKYKPSYDQSWALVIGINAYRHANPLEVARADAESIRDALIREFKFPKRNVCTLLDKQATRTRIMEKFLSYESLGRDDRLVFFFAGHGSTVQSSRGPIGYLVPVDGKLHDKSSLIRWDDLTRNADIIPAKHILFIMDACYSGLAIQRSGSAGERRFVSDMLQRSSRQVITAGKADEVVADGGGLTGNNSIFTGYLLEGLAGAAADAEGVITGSNLMNFAYRKVATDPRSKQTPHFGHVDGDGDFIFSTPAGETIDKTSGKDFLVKTVADQPEPPQQVDWTLPTPGFAERNNYADVESESFGRNEWSKRLGEWRGDQCVGAFGWLALVIEPVSNEPIALDLSTLARSLKGKVFGNVERNQAFRFPSEAMTTARSLVLYDRQYGRTSSKSVDDCWKRYVRIERTGAVEYCEYDSVARLVTLKENSDPFRVFFYVQLVGTIWTFLVAVKHVLGSAGYTAGIKYLVNMIDTENSVLAGFARAEGILGNEKKHWLQPFEPGEWRIGDSLPNWRCRDANLQFPFKAVLGSLNEPELKRIICECGNLLSLAYNHQSQPRCFPPGSDEFPWREYEQHLSA
ncbi:MAG: caspase domain-containing protein [Bryobacteraceae bacterium]